MDGMSKGGVSSDRGEFGMDGGDGWGFWIWDWGMGAE